MDAQAAAVITPAFEVEVVRTTRVPTLDDPALTFDDPLGGAKGAKQIETCVLYVDIRDSSRISVERRPQTLVRMYSAFVAAMLDCVRRERGHVRNIIGDRVMAVFDGPGCFVAAARTAALCNTVAHQILAPRLATLRQGFSFRCGIGVDYGTMLVTKAGRARRAGEREFYRSLVWLGRPANVASKLTDAANKVSFVPAPAVSVLRRRPLQTLFDALRRTAAPPALAPAADLAWSDESFEQFLGACEPATLASGEFVLRPRDPTVRGFVVNTLRGLTRSAPPVLITQAVHDGLRDALGDEELARHGWTRQFLGVSGYTGAVYGTDLGFAGD